MSLFKMGLRGLFVFFMFILIAPSWAAEQKKTENAALVNGKAITQKELTQEMGPIMQRMAMQGEKPDEERISKIKKKVLENMIDRKLLFQESSKKGFKADDAEVEKQLTKFKSRFPDEAQFKAALEQMNLSEDILRQQLREQMTIQQLIESQISKDVKISEQDKKEYYDSNPQFFKQPEQVNARHILIKADPQADDAVKEKARKKLEDIQKKLKDGGDFAALAKEFSEGPSSKNGGSLGFFRRGQMVKPFEDAAFSLKSGEISSIVETRFGYHLIKVEEKKPESTTPYKDVQVKLEQILKQQKIQEQIGIYLENLKKASKIEILI